MVKEIKLTDNLYECIIVCKELGIKKKRIIKAKDIDEAWEKLSEKE